MCITKPSLLDECDIDLRTKEVLLQNIKRRLSPQPVKCRTDIEVACYGYDGIDAIRDALKSAMCLSCDSVPIKISLIAPPIFVVTVTSLDRAKGLELLHQVNESVRTIITQKYNGIFKVALEPKVVTDHDDTDLRRRLEEAEAELKEVPADSEGSDEDDDEGSGDGEESGDDTGLADEDKETVE
ncbi:hypothetical protein ACOME3_006177 [Neoechinorhynchus agilis]